MEVSVTAQFKNGLLYRAVQICGNQAKLAAYLGVSAGAVGKWLNFKDVPNFRHPREESYKAKCEAWDTKFLTLLGVGLEEIFPIELQINKHEIRRAATMQAFLEMPVERLISAGAVRHLPPAPDEALGRKEFEGVIDDVLNTLPSQQQRDVLKLRFGLHGTVPHTLEETGAELSLTRERIRQIEALALRKLRHPDRVRQLKGYYTTERYS